MIFGQVMNILNQPRRVPSQLKNNCIETRIKIDSYLICKLKLIVTLLARNPVELLRATQAANDFYTVLLLILLVPGCKPKGPIKSGHSVRPSVTDYLRIRSKDFPKIFGDVQGKKYKKYSTAGFFGKITNFPKNPVFH